MNWSFGLVEDPSRRALRISAEGPARKERALTPSNRLKLSPAGPMVLHAPSVWEPFGKLRLRYLASSCPNTVGLLA